MDKIITAYVTTIEPLLSTDSTGIKVSFPGNIITKEETRPTHLMQEYYVFWNSSVVEVLKQKFRMLLSIINIETKGVYFSTNYYD